MRADEVLLDPTEGEEAVEVDNGGLVAEEPSRVVEPPLQLGEPLRRLGVLQSVEACVQRELVQLLQSRLAQRDEVGRLPAEPEGVAELLVDGDESPFVDRAREAAAEAIAVSYLYPSQRVVARKTGGRLGR